MDAVDPRVVGEQLRKPLGSKFRKTNFQIKFCAEIQVGMFQFGFLTYDKDKQKVVPPGAFSDPATWKVIPPGEFRLQCARPVGLMWRDHWE